MPTPVSFHVLTRVAERLDEHRVVVWYDPGGDFAGLFDGFAKPELVKVDARGMILARRREADAALARVLDPESPPPRGPTVLIYVPWRKEQEPEARCQEPFEPFAELGAAFGADAAESLQALARAALPGREAEVDALFSEGRRVGIDQLDALGATGGFPLLRQQLGTEDAVEVAVRLLATPEQVQPRFAIAGVGRDLERLLGSAFGFPAPEPSADVRTAFARWILFSEFALDLAGEVPPHTATMPRAGLEHRAAVFAVCDRLRGDADRRESYVALATEVEAALHLGSLANEGREFGTRDTFAAEDRAALRFVQSEAVAGRLASARTVLDRRRRSLWLSLDDRGELWRLATQALELLEALERWKERVVASGRPPREHVLAYVSDADGLWQVDRCHRLMEQVAAKCVEREVLQPLFEHARGAWRTAAETAQDAFLTAVVAKGWPPEGLRQTQVFARHIAPALSEGVKVAYLLIDAMRFEMGQDLARMLEPLGPVKVEWAAAVVPTATEFGMAALVPGADADFACTVVGDKLVPSVGGKPTPDVEARKRRFEETLGSRYGDVRFEDVVEMRDEDLRARVASCQLLVVRSDDIDTLGEKASAPAARRFMTGILDDALRVANRLARAGVQRIVFVADHGHLLLSAVPAGDVVRTPPGDWPFMKRRCRLGSAAGVADGVRIIPAAQLGIVGPVKDVAVASGLRVYSAGATYFHEGVSLQECLVPVVRLDPLVAKSQAGRVGEVEVLYKSDRVTTRTPLLRLRLGGLLQAEASVRVVAVAAGASRPVGRVADATDFDPGTGVVRLRVNEEMAVTVRLDDEFDGKEFEIQVLDAAGTGVVLGRKKLKNACTAW